MARDELVARVAGYATRIGAPVALNTEVQRVVPSTDGGFAVETSDGAIAARNVIVATGGFQAPRIPPIGAALPTRLFQVHSHAYRRPDDLPPGAVLVVGTGQSGVQLAEELQGAGRRVFLSVGTAGRIPRRYRGRDFFRWMYAILTDGPPYGVSLPAADALPDPRMRLMANPHLSGHGGGHDTNLRAYAADGSMTLIGRIEGVDGERLKLSDDLPAKLAFADGFFAERFQPLVDALIEKAGIDAEPDDAEPVTFAPPVPRDLDLRRAGITSVLWTTGYVRDYGWIEAPITDELGFPRQRNGVAELPGLFFIGSLWQRTQASATLFGVGGDAIELARAMDLPVSG